MTLFIALFMFLVLNFLILFTVKELIVVLSKLFIELLNYSNLFQIKFVSPNFTCLFVVSFPMIYPLSSISTQFYLQLQLQLVPPQHATPSMLPIVYQYMQYGIQWMDSIIQFLILSDVLAFTIEICSFLAVFVKALSLVIQYFIVIHHYPFFVYSSTNN